MPKRQKIDRKEKRKKESFFEGGNDTVDNTVFIFSTGSLTKRTDLPAFSPADAGVCSPVTQP